MKQFSACVLITATFLNVALAYAQMPTTGAAQAASAALTQAQGTVVPLPQGSRYDRRAPDKKTNDVGWYALGHIATSRRRVCRRNGYAAAALYNVVP